MLNYASECLGAARPPCRNGFDEFNGTKPRPTVLIVDDNPDIAAVVNIALRPFDIRTEAVVDGLDALMHMCHRRYDLVILDLNLGDVHGLNILRDLREMPLNKNVPVLVLTADGSIETMARSFGHGADEFMEKPFDLHELGIRAFRLIRPFGH